jgi:RNA polymerase subunit RPABC4/transcription elongation factor Spt4
MGGIVKAFCACGYKKELYLGGGMKNFTTYCNFPIFCRKCKLLLEVNLLKKDVVCPICQHFDYLAYDDPSLIKQKGNEIFSWNYEKIGRKLVLTDGKYLCPSCGQFSLSFVNVGNWD